MDLSQYIFLFNLQCKLKSMKILSDLSFKSLDKPSFLLIAYINCHEATNILQLALMEQDRKARKAHASCSLSVACKDGNPKDWLGKNVS